MFSNHANDKYLEIAPTNVMTGGTDRAKYLLYQLKMSMARAKQIDIIVSFLMESGVRLILNDLKSALSRHVPIRILTGNYLGITQPSALYLIRQQLGENIDLRFYNDPGRSFHPKSYIFHYEADSDIYIGSSNISRSALTSGIEWNYRFSRQQNPQDFDAFFSSFVDLFYHHSITITPQILEQYARTWHKPAVSKDLERYDTSPEESGEVKVRGIFEPRGVQIEALPIENQFALIRPLQKIQAAQKGGFPGAAGAQDGHHIALVHVQINALEHVLPVKMLVHIFYFQHHACFPP